MRAERLTASGLVLGEGPIPLTGDRFACVDIRGKTAYAGDLAGALEPLVTFESTVSSICATDDDDLLVTVGSAVRTLTGSGSIEIEHEHAVTMRLNDGKADPCGRFVAGTMADPPVSGAGALYSFADGRPNQILSDVTISNGLCWSADGSTMFYVDTPTGQVDAFDYDLDDGTISERRTEFRVPHDVGAPDGLTIDVEGGLWVALWGGSAVHRYLDGELSEVVEVPTPFATCPAFVGHDFRTLLVTTASEPNPGDHGAGDIFVARPGVSGSPVHLARTDVIFDSEAHDYG